MKKLFVSVMLVLMLLTVVCLPLAYAETAHTVQADASSVTISIDAASGEEVTVRIYASGTSGPAFIDQKTAGSQGVAFSTPLAQGNYTYRAYLATAKEYVDGSFRIGASESSAVSEPASVPSENASSSPGNASNTTTGQSSGGIIVAVGILFAAMSALAVLMLRKKGEKDNA